MTLNLVQLISTNKKDEEIFSHLKESYKVAIREIEQDKKEETTIEFVNKAFPLNIGGSTDLEVEFVARLIKGSALKQTAVWFYVPDGFELIDPKEISSWRQNSNFNLPNIRTVPVKIGTLSIDSGVTAVLKIKTPQTPGKYSIRYELHAEGYLGHAKDLLILVS